MHFPIKIFLILFFCIFAGSGFAQYEWEYGVSIGASNYLGEIGGKSKTRRDFVVDVKLAKTRWNTGMFVRYRWRKDFFFKAAFDYLRIEGADKLTTNLGRRFRNTNFRNDIFNLEGTTQLHFYQNDNIKINKHYRWEVNCYIFSGVGVFYHSPKTNYNGSWVKLRPLQTEGKKYKMFVLEIPMGIGVTFIRRSKDRFGLELNWHKTFTDYLDDISGNYPDSPPSNPMAEAVALRTDELPQELREQNIGAYLSHTWGQKRGDPTHKDNFMTISFTYAYSMRGEKKNRRSQKSIFKRKRSVRKIRTSF